MDAFPIMSVISLAPDITVVIQRNTPWLNETVVQIASTSSVSKATTVQVTQVSAVAQIINAGNVRRTVRMIDSPCG